MITESGRAVTAHHTVLVSNVIGVERNEFHAPIAPAEDAPRALQSLWATWEEMQDSGTKRSLREWLHDSQLDLNDVHSQYAHGILDLTQRAWAEQQYLTICSQIQEHLDQAIEHIARLSMSCRSAWPISYTLTFRYSSQCRMHGVSISCSLYCH